MRVAAAGVSATAAARARAVVARARAAAAATTAAQDRQSGRREVVPLARAVASLVVIEQQAVLAGTIRRVGRAPHPRALGRGIGAANPHFIASRSGEQQRVLLCGLYARQLHVRLQAGVVGIAPRKGVAHERVGAGDRRGDRWRGRVRKGGQEHRQQLRRHSAGADALASRRERAWLQREFARAVVRAHVHVLVGADAQCGAARLHVHAKRDISAHRACRLERILHGTGLVAHAVVTVVVQPALLTVGRAGPAGDGLGHLRTA
eukprot:scaffold27076_cov67-Phaeocystis_antarctica.AAC.2